MTVASETSKSGPYAGAGTTGPFTVGFRFLDETHLRVIKTSTTGIDSDLTLTTDYTVAGVGNDTGSVTLVTALASGEKLTIVRDVPFVQQTDYLNNDAFPAESHENALDLLTMQTQQLKERVDAALTLPSTTSGVSTQLPTPEANKLIGWDSVASGLQNYDTQTLATIVAFGTANADLFDGDGSTTQFTLSDNPGALNNLDVSIGGVTQTPGLDYTWTSGTTITFTSAPPVGTDNVLVRYMQALPQGSGEAGSIEYTPAGSGAVETNVQSKLREFVSVKDFGAAGDGVTDDTTEVQAAVAHCLSTGDQLYWPDGTYLTTASVPSFHSVRHRGPGAVQRGSDVFYVEPKEGQTNTLYVASSGGSVVNDALSSSQAVPSLQAAFDVLSNYWSLDGKWVIKLAAGTYTGSASVARLGPSNADSTAAGMAMRNALTIMGPDVGYDASGNPTPTPTAILNAAGAAAVGIALERGIKAIVRDVKFTNYNGSASSVGVFADNNSWLQCVNVHADTCTYGIAGYNHSLVDVKGGTINACTVGIQTLFNCKHEIGNQTAGAAGQGPFITNCTTAGFRAQEGSTGHSDYVSYQGNALAVDVQVNSRVNLNGSDFKLNTVAVRVAGGSNVFPTGVSWNTGTANANTENLRIVDASSIAGQNSNTWRALARQTSTQTVNGIATNSVVWTGTLAAHLYTSVPGSIYLGKAIRVAAGGTITGTLGTKTIQIRLGGSLLGGITFDAANNGSFFFEGVVYLTGSANQKTICRGQTSIGSGTEAGYATTALNTASSTDQSLTLTATLSAADTIVFEVVDFEVQG